MKCKECGAHLPYGAYGHIRCEFCNAPNYVPIPGEKPEAAGKIEAKKEGVKGEIETAVEKKGSSKSVLKKVILVGLIFMAIFVVLGVIGFLLENGNGTPYPTYTPKPTYTTRPTTRPLTTPSAGALIISDSFNSNVNKWPMDSRSDDYATIKWSLVNGKYRWDTKAHKGVNWYTNANVKAFSDIYLTVEAQQISGTENAAYGLVFRVVDGDNFYYFAINNNQQYVFAIQYKDVWTKLVDWTKSSAIRPGDVNKLEVIAEGSHIRLFINGQFVSDVYDNRLSQGKAGLAIELYNAGDSSVLEFDNFEITSLNPTTTTPPTTTPVPSGVLYDAIDLVPENIKGYTTEDREKQVMTESDLKGLDNCGQTSATASYISEKNENDGVIVAVLECDSEAGAKRDLTNLVRIFEENESVSFIEITLENNINAQWGWNDDDETASVFIWHQDNFLIFAVGVTGEGRDPYDVGTDVANSIILQSPLKR